MKSAVSRDRRADVGSLSPAGFLGARAFTLLELLVVVCAVLLASVFAIYFLTRSREDSSRVLCIDNLRGLGQAYVKWGLDTEQEGRTPLGVYWFDGGLRQGGSAPLGIVEPTWRKQGLMNKSWFQFAWISNQLQSPNYLVCPADKEKKPASTWGGNPEGGFVHPDYQSKAVSYLLFTDAAAELPLTLLSGDRGLNYNAMASSCKSGIGPVPELDPGEPAQLGIKTPLHAGRGNYLLSDGRVEELTSPDFARRFLELNPGVDNGKTHFLSP